MTTSQETVLNSSAARLWQSFVLGALWLGFVTYAFFLSPPSTPETLDTIRQLSTGHWTMLNPMVVVLFNLMGLWPVVYAVLALTDGREQAIPAWPFVVGSFALGAFALLPYLVFRKATHHLPYSPPNTALLKGLNHRLVGVGIVTASLILMAYGILLGDGARTFQDFYGQFLTSQFIHVMSLDFCMLTLLTPSLLWDDIARRQLSALWRALSLIPLLGPGLYLMLRPANP
ncbi:MAG: DUF2834 domain-containing protein [Cyanobacteria bacterium P01_D01_bin.156]